MQANFCLRQASIQNPSHSAYPATSVGIETVKPFNFDIAIDVFKSGDCRNVIDLIAIR